MCGIVGYGGLSNKVSLAKAIDKISHRGPDDSGTVYFDGVALGNTRLAIIDLSSAGHQPMCNEDKSLYITYNGEIYNFKEVKKILEKKYQFKSNTDTETILYAYQEWGVKCLDKLNGMFSFVIHDKNNNLLFGARDRLGQKPLKYYFNNGKFIFASEIKAILSLLHAKPDIDRMAIDDFLTFQYVPSPATGFKHIYKLPAGSYFIFKDNKLTIKKYWSLDFTKKIELSEDEWCEIIFSEVEKSVKSHLISDVPVGALLSGGLDSGIVVALMAKNSSSRINTFSIGFDEQKFDETDYAKSVARKYNSIHMEFKVSSKEFINHVPKITEVFDEPIGDNSILPTMLVSKLTSSKVKVALTGDGGDENFAGYDRYTFVLLSYFVSKFPGVLRKGFQLSRHPFFWIYKSKFTERMNRFLSTIDEKFYRRYVNYNCFFTYKKKQSLYSNGFKKAIGDHDSFERYFSFYDRGLSDLDNALKIDINTYLSDDLLYKSDSASMAYGLELRAPFLEHKLMEKIAQIPPKLKLRLFRKKYILKKMAVRYKLLPKEIVYRSKQGFNIPQNKWFKGPLKSYVTNQILSSPTTGMIFDQHKIELYIDNYFRTRLNYDNNIFALLMLSLWLEKYLK